MLIDQVHLVVQAGNGGKGCDSLFRRTDHKVVYNGGDGGNGGSVVFRAEENAPPIEDLRFKQHILAESGAHGGSSKKRGKNGGDRIVLVPIGTRVFDRQNNLLIRELNEAGESVVVARGGAGGVGNVGRKEAQLGQLGEIVDVEVTIRLRADVFFVGLPNSGKSALLNRLTHTHAKEETYPFATQSPQLGVCSLTEDQNATLCELPSVYALSHEGHGLGVDFLKHLERAKCVLYVVDPVSQFASTCAEGFTILKKEVAFVGKEFLKIPHAVVVTKADLPEAQEKLKKKRWKPGVPVFYISCTEGTGLDALKEFLGRSLDLRQEGTP
jgi:GTP-binding protein